MKALWKIAFPAFLAASLPLLAASQSQRPRPIPVLSRTLPGIAGGGAVTIRLVSVAGGSPVIGGESADGTVYLGNVSYFSSPHARASRKKTENASTTTTEFGIELESPAAFTAGEAMLSAELAAPSANCAYFIDGIRLSTAPQVISPRVRYGMIGEHTLKIEVPQTAPAGPIRASIIWIVTPEE
jgi:hypothetical protein